MAAVPAQKMLSADHYGGEMEAQRLAGCFGSGEDEQRCNFSLLTLVRVRIGGGDVSKIPRFISAISFKLELHMAHLHCTAIGNRESLR